MSKTRTLTFSDSGFTFQIECPVPIEVPRGSPLIGMRMILTSISREHADIVKDLPRFEYNCECDETDPKAIEQAIADLKVAAKRFVEHHTAKTPLDTALDAFGFM